MIFIDFEVFKNNWLCVAIDPGTSKEYVIVDNREELHKLYKKYQKDIWVGYNIRNYDQYILKGLLLNFNPKTVSDWIVVKKRKGWEFSSTFNKVNLILFDCMPNPPVSLKTLEGFMGYSIHETSVPFDIERPLTKTELEETIEYCRDDVLNTIEVFMRRKAEFDSQLSLIKTFDLPITYLGKTQAQLAAIILGAKRKRFNDEWDLRLPETAALGKYAEIGQWFLNKDNQNYKAKLNVEIAGVPHTVALGGLHGAKKKYSHNCAADEVFVMADVDQLYPTIMVQYKLLSRAVSNPEKFERILSTSLELKALKKKVEREPYKRICNITYGAEGDPFNPMYDPLHRNLVCIFGQILMIDLIDKIEGVCELIQSNTDGILVKVKKDKLDLLKHLITEWEHRTHLHMSFDEFESVYQKDVNNYVIVTKDGTYKSKGTYVKDLSELDYDLPIVNEAMKAYMLYGTPVEFTIRSCTDFRKFQKIVKLSNKYEWVEHERSSGNLQYLNKAYRVFASKDDMDGRLLKCKNVTVEYNTSYDVWWETKGKKDKFGNTPNKCFIENGDLNGKEIPSKLDYDWYINLAYKRLSDFGLLQ